MSKSFRKDLTGQRFGRLTVLEFVPTSDKHSHWLCKCDCGNKIITNGNSLQCKNVESCGCKRKETAKVLIKSNRRKRREVCERKLYSVWQAMKQRCFNPNCTSYENYGGRGISVSSEWKEFSAFEKWALANGYTDGLTIERIDNNGNYTPNNCRWASRKEQSCNRRSNIIVEYKGKDMCLSEVSEESGIPYFALIQRFHKGDGDERLFRPIKKKNN